jgi:hypothetical protein
MLERRCHNVVEMAGKAQRMASSDLRWPVIGSADLERQPGDGLLLMCGIA